MCVAILVNSCDKYEKIWPTFFDMFYRFWPHCPYPIYLNTEKKKYCHEKLNINVINSDKASWSARLADVLRKIDSDYIITMLDDFILEEPVDEESLSGCIRKFRNEKDTGVLQFVVGSHQNGNSNVNNPIAWVEEPLKSEYRINCQISLWRKSYLLKILRTWETPWEFEKFGSIRSRRYKEKVYSWGSENGYIFTYNWGKPIIGGKWNLDEIDRLENKLQVKFDTSERESMRNYYERLKIAPKPKRNIKWLIGKIKHIRSII